MNTTASLVKVEKSKKHCTNLADLDLVIECQRGSRNALRHLLERHERTITARLYQLAPDLRDTGDIHQEASIRIWRSIKTLRNPACFKSWLNQIVTNLLYDQLRKRPSEYSLVSIDAPLVNKDGLESGVRDILDYSPRPDEQVLSQELLKKLSDALSRIPVNFRTAVVLRDVEGFTYEEIAAITRTELGTIKSRIARARNKVKLLLSPYITCAA